MQVTVQTFTTDSANALSLRIPMISGQNRRNFTVRLRVLEPINVFGAQCGGCSPLECPNVIQNLESESAHQMPFFQYGTRLQYDCGKGRVFTEGAEKHTTLESECQWDANWTRTEFPNCECEAVGATLEK